MFFIWCHNFFKATFNFYTRIFLDFYQIKWNSWIFFKFWTFLNVFFNFIWHLKKKKSYSFYKRKQKNIYDTQNLWQELRKTCIKTKDLRNQLLFIIAIVLHITHTFSHANICMLNNVCFLSLLMLVIVIVVVIVFNVEVFRSYFRFFFFF